MAEHFNRVLQLVPDGSHEIAIRFPRVDKDPEHTVWASYRHGELTLGAAVSPSVPLIGSGHWSTQNDVSPDGQRVYFIDQTPAPRPSDINVVIGWRALLK